MQLAHAGDAGIIEEDIDTAELFGHGAAHRFHVGALVTSAGRKKLDGPISSATLFPPSCVAVDDCDTRSFRGEKPGEASPIQNRRR